MASSKGSQKLADAAGKALGIFSRLSATTDTGGVGLTHVPMPNAEAKGPAHVTPEALQFAKGLAFFSYTKVGVIVSAQTGTGFVIKKNFEAGSSDPKWSAPLFFSETGLGLGASVGVESMECMLLFLDNNGLEEFKAGGLTGRTNFKLHADFDKVAGSKAAQPVRNVLDADTRAINAVPYYLQSGVMLDWSTSSTYMKVSRSANDAAYGAGVAYDDILDGRVAPPAECAALYNALNAHMKYSMPS